MNMPGVSLVDVALAAAYGQLGDGVAARHAIRELLAIKPDYAAIARQELGKWFDVGNRRAPDRRPPQGGPRCDATRRRCPALRPVLKRPRARPPQQPSIAVLPFANMSADKDQEYFSDGLAEEIISLLAQVRT